MSARILVVDDESSMREFLGIALKRMGYEVDTAESAEKALDTCTRTSYDVVLTDIKMPDGLDGVQLLEQLKEADPHLQVILMTAFASVETAVQAVQLGASDYVMKPFKVEEIKVRVEKAVEQRRLLTEHSYLRAADRRESGSEAILGESEPIRELQQMIGRIGPATSTVLITGESGTGKEAIARAIHERGVRAAWPFISINCAATTDGFLESELFGHLKGSKSGAVEDREGRLLAGHRGTVFLDEVGKMDKRLQARLMRFLEDGEVRAIGSSQTEKVDVRVVAATRSNLRRAVREGSFRQDLYYRLNVIPIGIPPLRERRDDIEPLAKHFVERHGGGGRQIDPSALRMLASQLWLGNARELENVIERSLTLCEGERLTDADLVFEEKQSDL